jgi:exonuclease III
MRTRHARNCGDIPSRGRICIWKVGNQRPTTVREWILQALGSDLCPFWSLRRIAQVGDFRYDLFLSPEVVPEALDRLTGMRRFTGWHVREHRHTTRPSKKERRRKGDSSPRTITSWNVNGTRGKRQELGWFLKRERVAVLALQETRHKAGDWRLRLGRYQVLSSPMNEGRAGERGVALAIHPSLIAHEIGERSPFHIWARVIHPAFPDGFIVGSLYVISHQGPERRAMLDNLRKNVRSMLRRYEGVPVVLMGDWNMDAKTLDKTLSSWSLPLHRLGCRGSPRSRWRGAGTLRDLDHIVVSKGVDGRWANAWINRSWDLSDHWPVNTFPLGKSHIRPEHPPKPERVFIDGRKVGMRAAAIATHNRWELLAEEALEDPEEYATKFMEASSSVASDVGVTATLDPNEKTSDLRLSRKCKRLVEARRRAFSVWEQAAPRDKPARWGTYQKLKDEAKETTRSQQRADWARYIAEGSKLLHEQEHKRAWRWVKSLSVRTGATSQAPTAVRDINGNILADPNQIAEAWAAHYGALANDATGHSRDPGHWEEMGEERGLLEGLDDSISWAEVQTALRAIRPGKAPGLDGFPPEWYKILIEDDTDQRSEPSNPMGRALLRVLQSMWLNSSIPACWNKAMVVSIPKKGDQTCMDNYRGISLINVALKVLCMVVIRRISTALEQKGLLVPEQAGFRSREECMSQVVALYEVCSRRALSGQSTYALFVDFRKAYDTVPHEALLRKLWCIGIRGRAFNFVKALYSSSEVVVRVGSTVSEPFSLRRGLRQGCPMSPLLFDIFINDILEGQEQFGVEVPGVSGRKLAGLMFADDVVILAPDRTMLHRQMREVGSWASRWEMSVGAAKCGVTVFYGDVSAIERDQWMLQGQAIPVVESYTYLGIDVYSDWDLVKTAAKRSESARRALWALRPALGNSMIPLDVKILMIKALVAPVASFGGELLGMYKDRARLGQKILDQGLKWALAGTISKGTVVAAAALRAEFSLAPLHAAMSARRTRAWVKARSLKTWLSILVDHPLRHRKTTWVSGTSRWLKRIGALNIIENHDPKRSARIVEDMVWRKENEHDRTGGLAFYQQWDFHATRSYVHLSLDRPDLARGIRWLTRMRTRGIWTGPRAAKAKLVSPMFLEVCPSCQKTVKEDIPHILLDCAAGEDLRQRWIRPLAEWVVGVHSALGREELAATLLGGQVGGVPPSRIWLGVDTQISWGGTAPFLRVAEFLQEEMPRRMKKLWASHGTQSPTLGSFSSGTCPAEPTPSRVRQLSRARAE